MGVGACSLCLGGKWECTKKECIGTCVSWGDSHLLTFDQKLYDFLGECNYVMAKGKLTSDQTFELDIQVSHLYNSDVFDAFVQHPSEFLFSI